MLAKKVISVGANPELLWLRHAVLQSAGLHVATAENHEQAARLIQKGDCGVLLMCYSLDMPVRKTLAKAFRKRCPEGRIIAITNTPIGQPEFADDFVYGVDGPEALIDVIQRHGSSAST